jgi:hypothetical protein
MEWIGDFLVSILTGIINVLISIGEWIINAFLWVILTTITFFQWLGDTLGAIVSFFAFLIIQVVNAILNILGTIVVTFLMFAVTIIRFILDVIQNIIEVIQIVGMVIDIVLQIAILVVGWFGQIVGLFFGIIAGINGAPIVPVPGLPQCITAPMQSQICALWYIADWTLIADNTPGAFIVPIIVMMIDFVILVYVGRSIFKLIRWFQGVYNIA